MSAYTARSLTSLPSFCWRSKHNTPVLPYQTKKPPPLGSRPLLQDLILGRREPSQKGNHKFLTLEPCPLRSVHFRSVLTDFALVTLRARLLFSLDSDLSAVLAGSRRSERDRIEPNRIILVLIRLIGYHEPVPRTPPHETQGRNTFATTFPAGFQGERTISRVFF